MWPVPDLKAYLSGEWAIDRSLLDRRNGVSGEMQGRANFSPVSGALQYREKGTLIFGSHQGRAEQSLSYEFPDGQSRASVKFRDGHPFHDLDFSDGQAIVSHACHPDIYQGCFIALDERRWQSTWQVAGPRKDQQILTLYTRIRGA